MSAIQQYETAIKLFRIAFPEAAEYMETVRGARLVEANTDSRSGFRWSEHKGGLDYWREKYNFICNEDGAFLSEDELKRKCQKNNKNIELIPFNLQLAKSGNYVIVTNDKKNVKIFTFEKKGGNYPIIGLIEEVFVDRVEEYVHYWDIDGVNIQNNYNCKNNNLCLIANYAEKEKWYNVYSSKQVSNRIISVGHPTKEEADKKATINRVGYIKGEWIDIE